MSEIHDNLKPLELRIDWSEIDTFHHVNNVVFFKYMQASRVRLCDFVGLADNSLESRPGFMVVSAKCDFKKPLTYPGTVHIESVVVEFGKTSFKLQHRMLNEFGELAAIGEDVVVVYDFQRKTKIPIAPLIRAKLESLFI